MLTEIHNPRQVVGEGIRRWFTDEYFDLIVWYDTAKSLLGFQLCYDKQGRERAITWTVESGYQHNRIDAGEIPGHAKMTPVIIADGQFAPAPVAERFLKESTGIEPDVARFVYDKVKTFGP
jgi:hypothetical protein